MIKAEAEFLLGDKKQALKTLNTFKSKIQVKTKVEQFTLDLALSDAALYKKVILDGTYNKYEFDPFLQPIDSLKETVLSHR